MRRLIVAFFSAVLLFSGPSLASASSHSGNQTCTAGATVSVRGEMQRLQGWMTLKINGVTKYHSAKAYVGYGHSPVKSGAWSASAQTLLYSGTYGYCRPPMS